MDLGTIITNYRIEHNLSLGDFADMTSLSKTYVSMLEKGINAKTNKPLVPSIQTINACAKAMNYSIDELIELLDDDQMININDNFSLGDLRQIGKITNQTRMNCNNINNSYKSESSVEHEAIKPTSFTPAAITTGTAMVTGAAQAAGLGPLGILVAVLTYLGVKSEMHNGKVKNNYNTYYNQYKKIVKNDMTDEEYLLELLDKATKSISQAKINDFNKNLLINHFDYTKNLVKSLLNK